MNSYQRQTGLSLIELMIAMVIGLLLSIGTATIYFGTQKSSINRNEQAAIEDNGRIALESLRSIIEHAGYAAGNGSPLDETFITSNVSSMSCGGTNNVLDTALFGVTDDNASGDSLGVIYLGDDSLNQDCTGAQLPAACRVGGLGPAGSAKIYNYFSIDDNAAGIPVLKCAGSQNTNEIELAEGVENLQALYGIDTNNDNQVDQYVNAGDVSSWNQVVSVQLALLVRSLRPVKAKAEEEKYNLLDNDTITTNDRFQRSVFSTVVRLRNIQI